MTNPHLLTGMLCALGGMSFHESRPGPRFEDRPQRRAFVTPDSRAGRQMTGAKMGNHQNADKPKQGKREIERRRKQLERAKSIA
jgi:hypothetical protein